MKRLITILLVLTLPMLVFAGNVDKKSLIKAAAQPILTEDNQSPHQNPGVGQPGQYRPEEPMIVGYTWYDWVNYGSQTKTIALDNFGNAHMVWTNGLNSGSTQRHVYYNFYNPVSSTLLSQEGILALNTATKSGFACMDLMSDGRAVVCAHGNVSQSVFYGYPSIVGIDFGVGIGAFYPVSYVPSPVECDSCIWPHMATDIFDNIYVFGRMYTTPSGGDYSLIEYSSSTDGGWTYSQYVLADTVNVPSFTVATSRISGRAAFGYHQFRYDYNNHPLWSGFLAMQINNDAMVILKEDGEDWNWANPINITEFSYPDIHLLPDTVAAQGDTMRAYLDIELMFDNDDVLHAMFTCRGLYEAPWDTTAPPISALTEASQIWHWREDTGELTVAADGWWNSASNISTGGAGSWRSTICHPSMGIDAQGNLYCVYEGFKDYEVDPDTTQSGFANSDVYMIYSTDGGSTWSVPENLTNTNTNGMPAGQCASECFPCLAENVDEYLHILYMEDKEGSSSVFDSTVPTLNPMYYMTYDALGVKQQNSGSANEFTLKEAYPNPFNAESLIKFSLNKGMDVTMKIYDVDGREVAALADGHFNAGNHSLKWNAGNAASGVYFCVLSGEGMSRTQKLVLMK